MSKIWLIIQREYLTRVRKKSFILTTLLVPLGFGLLSVMLGLLIGHGDTKRRIAVVNESGYEIQIQDTSSLYFFKEDSTLAYLKLIYKNKDYDGILEIPPIKNLSSPPEINYYSDNQLGISGIAHIQQQLVKQLIKLKTKNANITEEVMNDINATDVQIAPRLMNGEGGETKVSTVISSVLGYLMGILIYMVMFLYGNMVMKGVAEEKTSRIIEIMISSVKPFQLMLGKILGVGAVGLTQLVLWAALSMVTTLVLTLVFGTSFSELHQIAANPAMASSASKVEVAKVLTALSHYNWTAIGLGFLFFFIGGYLLYGALFAAVGSAANESDDMQSLNVIIAIPIIAAMSIMASVLQDPNSTLAVWASIIPLTSPIIMTARIPFHPPVWQVILSMVVLIGGIIFNTWLAGRIYRVGILMYGKKVTLKEIGKWLFYK